MQEQKSRTFTGAWIETTKTDIIVSKLEKSHLYGCVNWNQNCFLHCNLSWSRTFTGAWIETSSRNSSITTSLVAPLRVRELKQMKKQIKIIIVMSHLYGCVNWNIDTRSCGLDDDGRTFTGAWIETFVE